MDTDTEHLLDLLFSIDTVNLRLALEILAQQPRLLQDTQLSQGLVLLRRVVADAQLCAQMQVLLTSFCDRRWVKKLDESFKPIDCALANTQLNWMVFEQLWYNYEQYRPHNDALLLRNPAYAQLYEKVARYIMYRFNRIDYVLKLYQFLVDKGCASELGEMNYTYLLFQHYFPKREQLDRLDQALPILEKAAQQQLRQGEILYNAAGYAYQHYLKRYEDAEKCYLTALRICPEHHVAAYNLARLYLENKADTPAALAYIRQALLQEPQEFNYRHLEVCIFWKGLQNLVLAEQLIQKLSSEFAQQTESWLLAGDFYASQGDFLAAEKNYKNGLKINPKKIDLIEALLEIYTQTGQVETAEVYQQQLAFLNKN